MPNHFKIRSHFIYLIKKFIYKNIEQQIFITYFSRFKIFLINSYILY